jgi:hypothetical protein
MKNRSFLIAVFTLLISIGAVSAQDTTAKPAETPKPAETAKPVDFSGKWVLDVSKSKLDERARIEAMTLTVTQTEKELKTLSDVKRTPPRNDMTPGGGRGGIGGGIAGTGPETRTFSLDGKETSQETASGGIPTPPLKLKAELKKDGTVQLSVVRKISGPMGEAEITTRETWSLSADGKILTIDREMNTPRGNNTSKLVLTKAS